MDSNLLPVPHVYTHLGFLVWHLATPTNWNTLPLNICSSQSICCFHCQSNFFKS